MRAIFFILISLFPVVMSAQGNSSDKINFHIAEEAYRNGQFDEAIRTLETGFKNDDDILTANIYRLLALCYTAMDQKEKAEKYVKLLLKHMPYYAISIEDPERFADLIKQYRHRRTYGQKPKCKRTSSKGEIQLRYGK